MEDVTKAFLVRKTLQGYRRGQGRSNSRRPVSLGMLEVLSGALPSVCFSPFEVQLFRTVFVLTFFRGIMGGRIGQPFKVGGWGFGCLGCVSTGRNCYAAPS